MSSWLLLCYLLNLILSQALKQSNCNRNRECENDIKYCDDENCVLNCNDIE